LIINENGSCLHKNTSKNCAKTSHFFSFASQVRSEIKLSYKPYRAIFLNHYTSYNRAPKQAKDSFMVVRFVGMICSQRYMKHFTVTEKPTLNRRKNREKKFIFLFILSV